ncbi:hypothetical protein CKM354_000455600 [Cercospora kikuchii]|uniref:Dicer-like protein 1 n=1 Tax=Cercospora kikuchii TaxID=84275 RepID=A0A9P3CED5_9PEZI|nr:uncharacterized protein CKM354_000455600 [Cercospora kikuchii]GIZ41243.1 hypothetical protein CKM354_000455600 [Cercospora kikuchii]
MGAPEKAPPSADGLEPELDDLIGSGDEEDAVKPLNGASTAASWKEKRRTQRAIFDNWITSADGQQALKPKVKKAADALDDNQSIHSLLASQQRGSQIVKNPREYQIELFERAKQQNTIAVLDTGSGKTLIAVLLLRWVIDNEIENRSRGLPAKISFFLVASVTLVYQQYSVLECNLDHNVARLCGADNTDRWNSARWLKELAENKVIVCTAEILNQALAHSYLKMSQINLLIFDEAHHTKKNHSYARIIKDFYLTEELASRPRIFGMTASPIDAKMDVVQAASELECLLDSKIATTSDMSLAAAIKKPKEEVLSYDALPHAGFETELLRDIKTRFEHIPVFSNVFERAAQIARHLGRWCADSYLLHAFSHDKSGKYEMEVEKKFHARRVQQEVSELDNAVKEIREAIEYVQTRKDVLDRLHSTDLSSKVQKLQHYLRLQFERPSDHRCIVFVDRRYTARMLHNLFLRLSTPHMRGHFLVGSNNGGLDEDSFSFKQQVLTLLKFRKGELNCLFATSVAEEGLDVPDCNLIVRFDMYATMIQYVQSRGRARNQNSKFIHMIERGNSIHSQTLNEVRYAEANMRRYCDLLPEDRKLEGNSDSLEVLLEREKTMEVRVDPISGAKLTYANALTILAHFVTAIPTESDEPQHPTYVVSNRGSKYIAEVVLPGNAPLRSKIGKIHTKKSLAKRSAAFDACVYLRTHGYLNENLIPIYQKKLPAMRSALLAVDMKATSGYAMQIKPKIWTEQRGLLPKELWVTIVDFPEGLDRPHQALAFLTRTPLPQLPSFPVFRNNGDATTVKSASLTLPLIVTDQRLAQLSAFTFRMFKDVFSKTYEEEPLKLSYWIAPVKINLGTSEHSLEAERAISPIKAIDWTALDIVLANDELRWTPEWSHDVFVNKFIVDKFDGSRKFFSKCVEPSLRQDDPIPDDAAKGKNSESILAYSVSLWKKSRAKITWAENQPVVEAELAVLRRNMLAPPEKKEVEGIKKAYLCPEPLKISALTPEVATSCIVWPSIIHRIESYLIAIEGCTAIGLDCGPKFALAAFTKDSDNQGEHDAERVNFQHGMGENYERLEFIGDTFLKTATTISTFIQNPNENEFEFHVRRMQMLCNKNLFGTAVKLKLYEQIRSMAFNRRYWYPEGLKLLVGTGVIKGQEKKNFHEPRTHGLGEKTIADVCEALIGAAYLTWDQPGAWEAEHWTQAVKAVTALVDSDDHRMLTWDDYRSAYNKPHYQTAEVTAVQRDLAEKVEREHAYRFKYPRLLYSAFMHPSVPYIYEKVPNYQRLEFLGDALLDQASITYLFHKYPDKDPQWLTEHKMAMVSNKFLGALCVNIGFHKHLRHHHAALQSQITAYAADLLEAKRVAGDSRDYWTTVSDPPKCLPDIVEAFIGAMFIDSDFNYAEVQRFFDEHVQWYFEDMRIYDTFANNHPCTHLHNMLQTTFGCMDYRLMAKELPSIDGMERKDVIAVVMIHDRIMASSTGKSGRYARLRVANTALEKLDGLAPFDFRAKYGCDCKIDETGRVQLGQDLKMDGEDAGGLDGACAI